MMTHSEAKLRPDYSFRLSSGINGYRQEIIDDKFSWWSDHETDGVAEWGIAVLEVGHVDIELNLGAMCNEEGTGYINKPDLTYFLCVKGKDETGHPYWNDGGYLDGLGYEVCVNWRSDGWLTQLEADMFENLMMAVKELDLSIDEPNFTSITHQWDVFNKISGTKL